MQPDMQALVERQRAALRHDGIPSLATRLERLERLRKLILDEGDAWGAAISTDFGHRSAVETTIPETMMVYSEIRHAPKHLKPWTAPQRIATALQFLLEGQEENVRAFKPLVEGFPDRGSVSSPEEIAQEIVPGIIRGRFV